MTCDLFCSLPRQVSTTSPHSVSRTQFAVSVMTCDLFCSLPRLVSTTSPHSVSRTQFAVFAAVRSWMAGSQWTILCKVIHSTWYTYIAHVISGKLGETNGLSYFLYDLRVCAELQPLSWTSARSSRVFTKTKGTVTLQATTIQSQIRPTMTSDGSDNFYFEISMA